MLSKTELVFIAFLCFHGFVKSQYSNTLSPESLGQGGVGVAQTTTFAAILNPASSAYHSYVIAGVYYYLPYHISELSYQNVFGILPTNYGVFSAFTQHYGVKSYQEDRIALNFSKELRPELSLGFQLNVQRVFQYGMKSVYQAYSGLGILYAPYDYMRLGLYLQNPERSSITFGDERILPPSLFVLGLCWDASEQFQITTEIEKQVNYSTIKKLGLQYMMNERIRIRMGVFGKQVNYSMGLGFTVNSLQVDVGIVHHTTLGLSSGIGLCFKPTKK
jgi:hypothetical protein